MLQRIFIFSLFALVCVPTSAADFYDVEVLVVQQLDSRGDNEELGVPNIRQLELNLELQDLLSQTSAIPLEPAIDGYLTDPARRIVGSRDYAILFHGRWSQTTSDLKTAPYIRIDLPATGQSHMLTGVLRLFATDLLYVDTFLRYRLEEKQTGTQASEHLGNSTQLYYFLKERRRVKFREVHFLDHPKFGVLLTVWPAKLPKLLPPTNEAQPAVTTEPANTQ